jgi:hypothetical protein
MLPVILLSSSLILGCSLTVPDVEVCVTLDDGSAYCEHTVSDINDYVDKEEWQAIQTGRFSMAAEDFAEYQTFVERACELATCTDKQREIRDNFLLKIKRMNSVRRKEL